MKNLLMDAVITISIATVSIVTLSNMPVDPIFPLFTFGVIICLGGMRTLGNYESNNEVK